MSEPVIRMENIVKTYYLGKPNELEILHGINLTILVLSAVFFMSGKVRSDLVALCALVLLILFNILTPEEALSGFSNSVVIMMVGLFVVGTYPLPKR